MNTSEINITMADNFAPGDLVWQKRENNMEPVLHRVIRISKSMTGQKLLITSMIPSMYKPLPYMSCELQWFFPDSSGYDFIYNSVKRLTKLNPPNPSAQFGG